MTTETSEKQLVRLLDQYKRIDELKLLCDHKIVEIRGGNAPLSELMSLQNELRESVRRYIELSDQYARAKAGRDSQT